ncbi:MAG TPA: YbhB/YbcL family Raf kinase inhibitor-like protein [Desulfobacterales bacterium]|nr:YbhB/YbcL family Raf kinase inhibitor-like protein [Desulfobacterales bacterium]
MTLTITSPAFKAEQTIPSTFTCEGQDISPPLTFSGIPEGTKSLVLIVDDPDAPDPAAPKMTWVHWLLYNLPPDTRDINEEAANLPAATRQGINDFKRGSYGGPCPPIGKHRYYFKLYALDTMLPDLNQPDKSTLLQAMQNHIIAQAQLIGLYKKQK